MKGLFITGTDTDAGKTYIACEIANALYQSGLTVQPKKPVESGCRVDSGDLIPEDALALSKACNYTGDLQEVCRYRFTQPLSPRLAAELDNNRVSLAQIVKACQPHKKKGIILVEGAGGVMSPLCENALNIDLASQLRLPLILVVNHKLGCINHTLLSIEAIQQNGLELNTIIINQQMPIMNNFDFHQTILQDTISEISLRSKCPVFYVEHNQHLPDILITHLLNTLHERTVM